jgi:uncharacterized membrane protein required for colicin V production
MIRSNDNATLQSPSAGTSVFPWLVLIALASVMGVLYFLGDKLGAMAMLPILLGAAMGYRSGAWKMFSMLLGSVGGLYFAMPASQLLQPVVENTMGRSISSPAIWLGFSGFVAGTFMTVASLIIGWMLTSRFLWLRSLDRNLGLIVGGGKSFALVAIALWTVLAMEPRMIQIHGASKSDDNDSSSLYDRFLSIGDATRKSPCLRYLVVWNPIATNATLNELLNKSQTMVQDIQSQAAAAQSGKLPPASKLTSMFGELQGSQNLPSAPEGFSIDKVGGMLQQVLDGQRGMSK